jgi:hypothetical protein
MHFNFKGRHGSLRGSGAEGSEGETVATCLPGLDGAALVCTKSRVVDHVFGGGQGEAI